MNRFRTWRERRRYHLSLAEWDSRKTIRVPLAYPENIAGSDEAAEAGPFPAWLAELAAAGIDAYEIYEDERRQREWGGS
jgi:hypothetical protein